MSFILDALRKSENERRLEATPGIMHAPAAMPRERLPLWAILAMGGLSVALVAVIVFAVLEREPAAVASPVAEQTAPPPADQPASARQVPVSADSPAGDSAQLRSAPEAGAGTATARQAPESVAVVAATETPPEAELAIEEPAASNAPPAAAPGPAQTAPAREASRLPDYAAVLAEGIGLGALQMQLHVHSSVASSRFVVINGRRYSEGDTLAEGPLLEEIAAEGAVLSYRGRRFLLTSN